MSVGSYEVAEGKKEYADIQHLLEKLTSTTEDSKPDEELFVTDNLSTLIETTYAQPGLRWRLNALNESLGSLRTGDFGFIFARPETGKTTFLASEVSFMAEQIPEDDGPIIWFNNEEGGAKVKLRVYQASLGLELPQLYADIENNNKKYLELTKGKIKIYDNANISRHQVEKICRKYKPSLIIFDQIDKIQGFKADREDLMLGAIYIWARELAKTYCPVIGVTQADGTGEGVRWLTMSNVANAKTSKQAEADWILGIGTIHDTGWEKMRFLNISKNKLQGDVDTKANLRHAKLEVLIEPTIARYRDI